VLIDGTKHTRLAATMSDRFLISGNFRGARRKQNTTSGFTLTEVVIAIVVLAIIIQGVIYGYIDSSRRAEWNGRSLAAQSLASQGVEQARAARWDPQAWPIVDELPPTNYVEVDTLDIPLAGPAIYATNYISITTVSANPLLRQIRADCVWNFLGRRSFTNTVITFRAPDQ
jgi:prepilin-type N-terminal cleavage/methylation domain-containing protein